MGHESDDKRRYKCQNYDEKLQKRGFTTYMRLVFLMNRMGMHFVHYHGENQSKHSCQTTKTITNKNSRYIFSSSSSIEPAIETLQLNNIFWGSSGKALL